MKNSTRIEWIDILKGIGIFYVTFAHLSPNIYLEKHIYSFHMFLFFFISGYLYKKPDDLKNYIIKKSSTLLLPFVFWDILSTAIEIIIHGNTYENISKMLMINGTICWNAPIWFLLTLLLVEISFAPINNIDNRYIKIGSILFSLVAAFILHDKKIILKLGIVPIAFFFYSIGSETKRFNLFEYFKKTNNIFMFSTLAIVNIIFSTFINARISVINCYYGNFIYCIISGLTGIYMYYFISNWIINKKNINRIFSCLGKNSLIIMCIQYYIFRFTNVISLRIFQYDIWHSRNTIKALLFSIITIYIILLFSKTIKLSKNNTIIKLTGIR